MLVIGRMVILIPLYDGSYGNDINGIGKTSENEQKIMVFFSFFAYSSKLVDMQKLVNSLREYLKLICFRLIFYFCNWFQAWKRFEMNKKGWKQLKTNLWPALGLHTPSMLL